MAKYIVGNVSGNQIYVHAVSDFRVPEHQLDKGATCLLLTSLAGFKSKVPESYDTIGVYTDPNGARFAVAAKMA